MANAKEAKAGIKINKLLEKAGFRLMKSQAAGYSYNPIVFVLAHLERFLLYFLFWLHHKDTFIRKLLRNLLIMFDLTPSHAEILKRFKLVSPEFFPYNRDDRIYYAAKEETA